MQTMYSPVILIFVCISICDLARVGHASKFDRLTPALWLELLSKYDSPSDVNYMGATDQDDLGNQFRSLVSPFRYASNRVAKDFDGFATLDEDASNELYQDGNRINNPELSFNGPSNNGNQFISHGIRDQEALEHSALWRHQMMQGGAGEGQQHLKPDGSVKNVQVVKSDAMLPAYCTPPNPCPPGYTEEDGCLSNFENSAAFSRQYQSMQDCMCDTEHMFNCDARDQRNEEGDNQERSGSNGQSGSGYTAYITDQASGPETAEEREERQLDTIARSLANQPIDNEVAEHLIDSLVDHKVVAKKFMVPKPISPFLHGEKLAIVAKKSPSNHIYEQ